MRIKTLPLVEVHWIDSAFHRGWSDTDTKRKEMCVSECRSIGYLMSRDRYVLKLAMHTADDGKNYGDGISIPASTVKNVRRLK